MAALLNVANDLNGVQAGLEKKLNLIAQAAVMTPFQGSFFPTLFLHRAMPSVAEDAPSGLMI